MEKKVKRLSEIKKVVLVTGSRQVGKTTMLKMIKEPNRSYVTLDDLNIRKENLLKMIQNYL